MLALFPEYGAGIVSYSRVELHYALAFLDTHMMCVVRVTTALDGLNMQYHTL